MKLVIDNDEGRLPYSHLLYLQEVFQTAARVLHLDSVQGTVKVRTQKPTNVFWCTKCKAFHSGVGTAGATDPEIYPGNEMHIRIYDHGEQNDPGETLAHELVHVRDALAGRLVGLGHGANMWDRRYYSADFCERNYMDLPWEVRARAGADQIMEQFAREQGLAKAA